ncbi:MAG TPA: hypothetical protein VHP33_20715, partial [Polyangiaceae bacterium]|nr:hypothetical protein [Polyangiaceae bacterium]
SAHLMRAAGFGLAVALAVAACGGPHFNGTVYDDGKLHFRTGPIPTAWHAIEADGTLLAFRDDATPATVALNGRCGVDGDDVPLASLTQHLFLQFTERELKSQQELNLDGRAALRTELTGKLDGVPKQFLVYVLKKDGCVYDFWRISEPTAADPAPFEIFVKGFATES